MTDKQAQLDEAIEESFPASDPPAVTPSPTLRDNQDMNRFEMDTDAGPAFVKYEREKGVVDLYHTEVPKGVREQGIGTTLVLAALDRLRAEHVKVKPTCPFVQYVVDQNPEYRDMIA